MESATTAGRDADPGIAALVPRASRGRNAILALVVVLVLVGAWFSPPLFRPSLGWELTGGATAFGEVDQVVTFIRVAPQGFPSATVVDVGDVPGATAAGAWLVTDDEWLVVGEAFDPGSPTTGEAYVRAALVDGDLAAHALPQESQRSAGEEYLVVLWQVTDCARLSLTRGPRVEVRTPLGAHRTETPEPMPGMDRETVDPAVCD